MSLYAEALKACKKAEQNPIKMMMESKRQEAVGLGVEPGKH